LGFLQAGPLEDPSSISNHILTGGIPEEFDLRISEFFALRTKCFVDVGANIGLYCLRAKALNSNLEVYAFEPQPSAIEMLLMTRKLNKWNQGFEVHQVALSNDVGTTTLHLAGTGSTLDSRFLGTSSSSSEITVRVKLLDEYRGDIDFKNSFVKIDVEGHELRVLQGATKVIVEDRPVWFIEIAHTINSRSFENPNFDETISTLQKNGYRCYVSDGRVSLRKFRKYNIGDGVFMYLFIPAERSKGLYLRLQTNLLASRIQKTQSKILRRSTILARQIFRGVIRRLKSGN
jgi:FkbM family methyltransferase